MNKPEGQCLACGSLPYDEDRIECDYCYFGVEEFPPAHVRILAALGERAFNLFLIAACLYLLGKIALWALRGCPVMP